MSGHLLRFFLFGFCELLFSAGYAQSQTCPVNSNFSMGSLTHWWAYTGNNKNGNGAASIRATYDSTKAAPSGTIGATAISEYQLGGIPGIQVITKSGIDPFGGFTTIPVINGYSYNYSLLLGSTQISHGGNGNVGGYTRGISYLINVPVGPRNEPYTMTYAYAMVLENGTHNSNQQPMFSATLKTKDSVITCASPSYLLPTSNNADSRGTGATLNVQAALAEGFTQSGTASPNENANGGGGHLQDVWTKGWREVTFDLSPYRGQQVSLTFESDNCIPGGHFAYAYIALRNSCAGLFISGDTVACSNSNTEYSIPALGDGSYSWSFPPGWQVLTNVTNTNIINVIPGPTGGKIIAHEINGCANLTDTLTVTTSPPTIPGALKGGEPVCTGDNTNTLVLEGSRGSILNWVAQTDAGSQIIADTNLQYTANNLTATTTFKALVQNGASCALDTSLGVTILVYQKSVGGQLAPSTYAICKNQDKEANLTVKGNTGDVVNWQLSEDGVNWSYFNPVVTALTYGVNSITVPTDYRVIVKNGVCPQDTSSIAVVTYVDVPFPKAETDPADTTICFATTVPLNAQIFIGTSYNWTNVTTLSNAGDGSIAAVPYSIHAIAAPLRTTTYVLSIVNNGCPNALLDTFQVNMTPRIVVDAGRDTSVVFNQPLQWTATSSDTSGDTYLWTPPTALNDPNIYNPIGIYSPGIDSVRYLVKATATDGCYGTATVLVRVYKTAPDIFVPNAFTPGTATNNIFRPIAVGIATLRYFRVYNRWGQLMYQTEQMGQGWDGSLGGRLQQAGSYVWMADGVDYTGKTIFRKGFMVLVR